MNPPTPFLLTVHPGRTAGVLLAVPALLIILATGANAFTPSAPLSATITMSGNVTDAMSGAPVAGATVSTNLGASTTTNTTGGYILTVQSGSFTVTVFAAGFHGLSQPVTLRNSAAGQNLQLNPYTFTVRGTVAAASTSLPIVGANVSGPFHLTAITNTKGVFTLLLENGTFPLTVNATGYRSSTIWVTVNGTTQTPYFLLVASLSGNSNSGIALSGPALVLAVGLVLGAGTAGAVYVVLFRRGQRLYRGAPLAGLPSQQTEAEAAHPRSMDRRATRRRR